jgi:hypothetical protein
LKRELVRPAMASAGGTQIVGTLQAIVSKSACKHLLKGVGSANPKKKEKYILEHEQMRGNVYTNTRYVFVPTEQCSTAFQLPRH